MGTSFTSFCSRENRECDSKCFGIYFRAGNSVFESEEGKARLSKMIDDFFASRGTLLNLVGMFLGNVSVVDRVQPEVIKFLGQDGTKQLLTEVLQKSGRS